MLGTPDPTVVRSICSENTIKFVESLPLRQKIPYSQKIQASPEAIDLLERILVFDPKSRITAQEALLHPYFQGYQEEEQGPAPSFDWSFTSAEYSAIQWKEVICKTIAQFQQEHPR